MFKGIDVVTDIPYNDVESSLAHLGGGSAPGPATFQGTGLLEHQMGTAMTDPNKQVTFSLAGNRKRVFIYAPTASHPGTTPIGQKLIDSEQVNSPMLDGHIAALEYWLDQE
jgi:hypothetical protein